MDDRTRKDRSHQIIIMNRENFQVTGVIDVESFDSEEFLLNTEYGYLHIHGQNLHIKSLDLEQGRVTIEGLIDDMGYLNEGYGQEKAKGFFGKLFK
ncbi:sporulation protein YabP [Tepidibacillus fermentans]|uniref:Sporulation protein YabP n=1 Tax=Tepidibacillus fermentans TaxID=1281767 RepID=A0A4R3KAY6_9BACI|nr:sporulation protein YabP [Tepidibacillus fermentans]TCS80155.1 sporulation protein YabP [Tepidibacillus fermentans]